MAKDTNELAPVDAAGASAGLACSTGPVPELDHALYFDDLDEGGMYRWHMTAKFEVRLPNMNTLRATISHDDMFGAQWKVELRDFNAPAMPDQTGAYRAPREVIVEGDAEGFDAARGAAMAAMIANGYVPRKQAAH